MIDIDAWCKDFQQALDGAFGERAWFVGLQGSHGRGEATEASDIDIVVVLDHLSPADLAAYRAMLDGLAHRERICGFLAGREELRHWDAADLFQFCHDTTPLRGSLATIAARIDRAAVARAVKRGACDVYHACVHNMLHKRKPETLRGLYKAATFVVRARAWLRSGRFCRRLGELRGQTTGADAEIVAACEAMARDGVSDFDKAAAGLFLWAQATITGVGKGPGAC